MIATVAPVPAAMMRARKRVVRSLGEVGATGMASAVPYAPTRRLERKALTWLVEHDIVKPAGQSRYFLDEEAAAAWRRKLRTRTMIAVGGALAAVGAVFALSR